MYPYFTEIENQLISQETRSKLIEIGLAYGETTQLAGAEKAFGTHWKSIGLATPEKSTEACKAIRAITEITNLEESIKISFIRGNLVYMLPTTKLTDKQRRHVDADRGCSITIPLWPIGDTYAETVWWDVIDAPTPSAARGYSGGKAFLLNTKKLHSVAHYDCLRFSFQISFQANYNTVLQAMLSGNFRDK